MAQKRKRGLFLFLSLFLITCGLATLLSGFGTNRFSLSISAANNNNWVEAPVDHVINLHNNRPQPQSTPSSLSAPLSASAGYYTVTTSATDPTCDTGFNGYVNLADFSIFPQAAVSGDTVGFAFFTTGNPISFYGQEYQGLVITDDGLAIFDAANFTGKPWEPQMIPDPTLPNNLAAMLWQDMEIIYDQAANRGVSAGTSGDDVIIVEYDDIQLPDDVSSTYDFEIVMTRSVNDAPGAYEIVYAYDNLAGSLAGDLTIGVENDTGSSGASFVNQGSAVGQVQNGLMICFDYVSMTPTSTPTPTGTASPTLTPTATPQGDPNAGWQEVGSGSAGGSGISSNNYESSTASLAIAPDGKIYAAWANNSSGDSEIYVRRWNGSSWEAVGSSSASGGGISNNGGSSQGPSIAIAPDGTPYVAWFDNSGGDFEIYVKRWNGSSWVEVGSNSAKGGGISKNNGESSWPSLVIANNGKLHIAWDDDSSGDFEIYLLRWNGSSWVEVGQNSASGGGISNNAGKSVRPSTAVTAGGQPLVAWNDDSSGSNEIYIKRWDGSGWVSFGPTSAENGGVSDNAGTSARPSLILDSNDLPVIAWDDNSAGDFEIFICRWNGQAWEELGPDSANNGGISDNQGDSKHAVLTAGPAGQIYAAWEDNSSGDYETYIRRWKNQQWEEVGNGSTYGGGVSDNQGESHIPALVVDKNGIPYVAWHDNSSSKYEIYIRRYGTPPCYLLSRSHTGAGGDPAVSPGSSYACQNNRFVAGSSVNLFASPSNGWRVGTWDGTDHDNNTTNNNGLTMPGRAHEVSVNYVQSPLIQLTTSSLSANEDDGQIAIEIIRSGNTSVEASIWVITQDGTAAAGDDYVSINAKVSFSPGETRKAVDIEILDDALDEADETINVTLSNPTGAVLGTLSNLTLTIIDDDEAVPTATPTATITTTPTPSPTSDPHLVHRIFLPLVVDQPPGVLVHGFTARWDGEIHYRDINGRTRVGTHLTRQATSLIDNDTVKIDDRFWYNPNPFNWDESVWFEFYSLTTGALEYSSNPPDPSWKWEAPWLAPYDWNFSDGQTLMVDGQEFSVKGPLPIDTAFGGNILYWHLQNKQPFVFWEGKDGRTQRVAPGDVVLWYDAQTRLLIYRDLLRTVYVNGIETSDTIQNITDLSSSSAYE